MMAPKDIGLWLTIISMGATGVARFVALEEAKGNAEKRDQAQNEEIGVLKERLARDIEKIREAQERLRVEGAVQSTKLDQLIEATRRRR